MGARGLAVVATSIAGSIWLGLVGAVAAGAALWIGTQRRDLSLARAVVAAVSLNVAIRSNVGVFFEFTALVVFGAAVLVVVSGVRRRHPASRRSATIAAGLLAALATLALAGAVVAGVGALGGLRDGSRLAREGISMLQDGEYASAAEQFDRAAEALSVSESRLGAAWAAQSSWLPFARSGDRP